MSGKIMYGLYQIFVIYSTLQHLAYSIFVYFLFYCAACTSLWVVNTEFALTAAQMSSGTMSWSRATLAVFGLAAHSSLGTLGRTISWGKFSVHHLGN